MDPTDEEVVAEPQSEAELAELAALATAAEEKRVIEAYLAEVESRQAWKLTLRQANADVSQRTEEGDLHKLDSSLKKNTAFIRKLKNYTEAQKETILKELYALNLSKYMGEVASAFIEAKLKLSDLNSAVELCSALHQRYAEFSASLLESWARTLNLKKDERVANPSKFRVDLRFYADCVSVGLFPLKDGLQLLGQVLTALVQSDKENLANIALIMTFCKHCGDDYAGLLPTKMVNLADKYGLVIPRGQFLAPEKQKNVRHLLKEYYQALSQLVITEYRELQQVEKTNRSILLSKGELFQDRRDKADGLKKSYEKLQVYAEQLSDLLDEALPELPPEDVKKKEDELIEEALEIGGDESALGPLWEDEETKSFYENLVELQAIIPAILYRDSKDSNRSAQRTEDPIQADDDVPEEVIAKELEDRPEEEEEVVPPQVDEDVDEPETSNPSAKMLLDAFLAKVPACVSRDMIDSAAVEFCMSLNTRSNRKKLVKALFNVHRNRTELLPFYSRLVASLEPVMPEVPDNLSTYLKQEFRWQVRKKDQMKIESKLKVCRFIGEMVKFKMFLKSEVLFCLKQLLFDFSHHHIEMACILMETCGRFLYRSPDSHRRTKIYLEQMMRKKGALSMDSRYAMMIENAYYNVNPPEVGDMERHVKPLIHQYIDKLLFLDLSRPTLEKVLKQIRKLDWGDKEVSDYLVVSLSSAWKVKYFNIQYLASLLAGLVSHHDWVGPKIVDAILEDVRLHMEINDSQYNQRRIAMVKFLAELYNYRQVDSGVIFKVLYSLISYGVVPSIEDVSYLDPPDHLLRVRLACVILEACGAYFNSGSSKKKLDYFSAYFQLYYWRKREHHFWQEEHPFPISVTNHLQETLSVLRPKLKIYTALSEVMMATDKIERDIVAALGEKAPEYQKYIGKANPANAGAGISSKLEVVLEEPGDDANIHDHGIQDDHDDDLDEDEDTQDEEINSGEDDDDDDEDEDNEIDDQGSIANSHSQEEDLGFDLDSDSEDVVPKSVPKLVPCEDDDDFVSMFDRMLNDNILDGKGASSRGHQMDIIAPVSVKRKKAQDIGGINSFQDDSIQFTLLHRKGNKPAYRDIAVPLDSDIARNFQKQEEADRLEKEKVKKLTLQINERQEEEDMNEALAAMQRPTLVKVHRERRRPIQPPKGAPDADLIFGSKRIGK